MQKIDKNLKLYGEKSRLILGSSINSQKKTPKVSYPFKKRNGSGVAQSEFDKADEFNGQFADVFTKTEHNQVPLLDRSASFMEEIVVTKEGLTKLLKGLNPSKALGPDELHPRVLEELETELGPVFAHLFSNRLIQVQSLVNGLLQTFVPCSRRVTGLLHAIIAQFP